MKNVTLYLCILIWIISACGNKQHDLRNQALQAIEKKKYKHAVALLDQAIQTNPQNQELHYIRGQALRLILFDDGSQINSVDLAMAKQASEAFEHVIKINPKYDGLKFVVDPYTKIQGIWGSVATTYTVQNKIDSARWALKKGKNAGAFYPAIVEYNRNIMASCDSNAILFTNGDNDTYPMWYLQLIENYRTDITVVNLSLLNTPWYGEQLRQNYPYGTNSLQCIAGLDIERLKTATWSATRIRLPEQTGYAESVAWTLEPTVNGKLIRRQDLMIVEILKRNKWRRPVYFSTTVYSVNKIGLDDFLRFEGLVLRLIADKRASSPDNLHKNLLQNYTYEALTDRHLEYISEMQQLYRNYTVAYNHLIDLYTKTDDEANARAVKAYSDRLSLPKL